MKTPRMKPLATQLKRMEMRWPNLQPRPSGPGALAWLGPLRGFQRPYHVFVRWSIAGALPPLVFVLKPQIEPREGETFDDIPHLIFDEADPRDSALCLFDPEEGEWGPHMLIADTTIPWASEWLHAYELWHATGVWSRASAPGPASRAELQAMRGEQPDAARA